MRVYIIEWQVWRLRGVCSIGIMFDMGAEMWVASHELLFLHRILHCPSTNICSVFQKTQKHILDYVKQQCDDFSAFKEQCVSYVELYGPLALNMARQYLSPDLCTQLGFCPDPSPGKLTFSA